MRNKIAGAETRTIQGHQHFNNGGITYTLIETVSQYDDGSEFATHELEIGVSNMGLASRTRIPVFATTGHILHALARHIDTVGKKFDYSYIAPVNAHISDPRSDVEGVYVRGPSETRDECAITTYAELYGSSGSQDSDSSESEDDIVEDEDTPDGEGDQQ